jgi:hypothetical protein
MEMSKRDDDGDRNGHEGDDEGIGQGVLDDVGLEIDLRDRPEPSIEPPVGRSIHNRAIALPPIDGDLARGLADEAENGAEVIEGETGVEFV